MRALHRRRAPKEAAKGSREEVKRRIEVMQTHLQSKKPESKKIL